MSDADIEVLEGASATEEREIAPEEALHHLMDVPLFSDLDRGAFMELSRAVKLRTVGDGCLVFKEG